MPGLKWVKEIPIDIISMITDDNDNIYLAGDIKDTIVMGNDTLVPVKTDVVLAKYDSSGNLLWYKMVGGPDYDNTVDIRLDNNNNVFLLVLFDYTIIIEGDTIPYLGVHRPLLVKYSADGDFLWWKMPAHTDYGCFHPRMLRSDHDNNLIMMSSTSFAGNVIFPDTTLADSLGQFHISKYNADGTFQWARAITYGIEQMTTDNLNNVLLIKATDTNSVYFFIKLSPEGNLIWKREINFHVLGLDDNLQRWFSLFETDHYGNIYLATSYWGATLGNQTFTARGGSDILLIKFDSFGNYIWGISSGGPFDDYPNSLFIKDDRILLTGSFKRKIIFAHDSIIGYGTSSYTNKEGGFIASYDLNGQNESIKKIYAKRGCQSSIITMGKSMYLFGHANDSTYFDDYLWSDLMPFSGVNYFARFYDEPSPPGKIIEDYLIYPNPTKGMVNFDFNPSYGKVDLQIYNLQGALLRTFSLNNNRNSIDLGFLSDGFYFVKIISEESVKCIKFEKV